MNKVKNRFQAPQPPHPSMDGVKIMSADESIPVKFGCEWHLVGRQILFQRFLGDMAFMLVGLIAFTGVFFFTSMAFAHTPLMACFDNGDGTITCNGGFSDGSSASGVAVRVTDDKDKTFIEGTMDHDSEFTFDKPAGRFTVVFDAGPGHLVKEKSDSIE